jgi:hypothetical protein
MLKFEDYIKKRMAIEIQKHMLKNQIAELNRKKFLIKIEMFNQQKKGF